MAASEGLLTLVEILALSMLTSGLATNVSNYLKKKHDAFNEGTYPTVKSLVKARAFAARARVLVLTTSCVRRLYTNS